MKHFLQNQKRQPWMLKEWELFATEIFKTINGLKPQSIKEICVKKVNPSDRKNDIIVRGYLTTA